MRLGSDPRLHLGYCTNIHPANGWTEVLAGVRENAPAVRAALGVRGAFGLGLRLSGAESRELQQGDRLAAFRELLEAEGLYVFTINGFPHGSFHGQPVKADVHAPDWRSEERVAYTVRLAEILRRLLPAGIEGSISTNPLSYAAWIRRDDDAEWDACARNLARVAAALAAIESEDGTLIHVDLEPEADGLLADCAELEAFYVERLLTTGARELARALGIGLEQARERLRRHIGVCFDACHSAVAYETPETAIARLRSAGIPIGKVQLSSALSVPLPDSPADRAATGRALGALANDTYLHQVVQRNADGTLRRYPDLPQALERLDDPTAREWRVHMHVPIFVESYAGFRSTQDELRRVLDLLRDGDVARHLEIETYTWSVLPAELRTELIESIRREYEWVLDALG
jgi:sugar phosphate isomerase/epimerase